MIRQIGQKINLKVVFVSAEVLVLCCHQIRVNAVNPTVVLTQMGRLGWSDPEKAKIMTSRIPLGRFAGQPLQHLQAVFLSVISSVSQAELYKHQIYVVQNYSEFGFYSVHYLMFHSPKKLYSFIDCSPYEV